VEPRPPSRYLTSIEVASVCGVSTRTVSNWIRDGAIPAHRTVGGHGRVSIEDLRRFLQERGMPVPEGLGGAKSFAPGHPAAVEPPARRRVLVIDDDEPFLDVVREILGSSGYAVETARHGFLAGYLAAHHRPAVILLDILMPGVDGYEVLALMRKRPEGNAIPVVACTSLRGPDVEARIRAAGFDAYLRKPIDFRGLLATLERLVP